MPFDHAVLLAPVIEGQPCGPALDEQVNYIEFRGLSNAAQRPNWARYMERAVALAQGSRDLRAWVWLTRASLCAHGAVGLAAGLRLIADGLERYWDVLPPQHADEDHPAERFMMRLSALTQLGATNLTCSLIDLRGHGRNFTDLQSDLDDMAAKVVPDALNRAAIGTIRAATAAISDLFARQFGAGRNPYLGFEVIMERLDAIEAKIAEPLAGQEAPDALPVRAVSAPGTVQSRDDVVRALDAVLQYYQQSEPSSPVPLLVERAKRLVSFSFMDAIKELAPGGLKELQAVAGTKPEKT